MNYKKSEIFGQPNGQYSFPFLRWVFFVSFFIAVFKIDIGDDVAFADQSQLL